MDETTKRLARDEEIDYPFKQRPWLHQLKVFNMSRERNVFAYFTSMGTGKTAMCVHCIAWLHDQQKIDGVLLIAPKGVYRNWQSLELPAHMPEHVKYEAAYWTSNARSHEREALSSIVATRSDQRLKILSVNVEALSSKRVVQLCEMFLKANRCMVVVDESTVIKSPVADRTKTVIKLGTKSRYKRILSGNPIPNGPLDIFTQAQFLDLSLLGFSNFHSFKNRFAVMQPKIVGGGRQFMQIVGYRDQDYLSELMKPWSVVVKKEDCLDLPPKVYVKREVELSEEQRVAYDDLVSKSLIEFEQLGDQVTAPLVITQMMRLQQVCCGFVNLDGGGVHEFADTPKMGEFEEFLEQSNDGSGKTVVWATFRHNIEQIVALIGKKFGPERVVHFYGSTSNDGREYAKTSFQDLKSGVDWFVGNPQSGGMGITLTAGTKVGYFSNDYNLQTREQSEDRCHRIGTVNRVTYYDFPVRSSVEDRILKVLASKKKMTDDVMISHYKWLLGA